MIEVLTSDFEREGSLRFLRENLGVLVVKERLQAK